MKNFKAKLVSENERGKHNIYTLGKSRKWDDFENHARMKQVGW